MPVLIDRNRPGATLDESEVTALSPPIDAVLGAWTGGGTGNDILNCCGPLRVLIIDDNRDAADSLSILVKMWGHHAAVAYDGAAALARATDELPDVLFIDIGMPKINGYQLAGHLRCQSRFAESLLVAITGWADEPHRRLWADAFDHYLNKPVDPPALEKLLRDRGRLVRSRIGGEMNCHEAGPGELLGGEPRRSPALQPVVAGISGRSPAALARC